MCGRRTSTTDGVTNLGSTGQNGRIATFRKTALLRRPYTLVGDADTTKSNMRRGNNIQVSDQTGNRRRRGTVATCQP